MDPQDAIDFSREAIKTCITVGGPVLAVSLLIGLLVSVLQSMTQLHDQSISFVPKILLLLVAIAVCLPWLSDRMLEFTKYSFEKPVVYRPVFDSQSAFEPTDSTQNQSVLGEDRTASFNERPFQFQWANEPSKASSIPTLRSPNSIAQPQLRPETKLQPRPASPFLLPAFRQADAENSDAAEAKQNSSAGSHTF